MKNYISRLVFLVCFVIISAVQAVVLSGEKAFDVATEASIASVTNALVAGIDEISRSFFADRHEKGILYIHNNICSGLVEEIRRKNISGIRYLSYHAGGFPGEDVVYIITGDTFFKTIIKPWSPLRQQGTAPLKRIELNEYCATTSIVSALDSVLPALDALKSGSAFPIAHDVPLLCIIYEKPTRNMGCVFMEYASGEDTNRVVVLEFMEYVRKHTEKIGQDHSKTDVFERSSFDSAQQPMSPDNCVQN